MKRPQSASTEQEEFEALVALFDKTMKIDKHGVFAGPSTPTKPDRHAPHVRLTVLQFKRFKVPQFNVTLLQSTALMTLLMVAMACLVASILDDEMALNCD